MIEFGLQRITRLLRNTPQSWKAVHVAGTNGKGSVCAYTSAMLHNSGIKCGRFTSPHLLDRWDCISIKEQTVSSDLFHEVEAAVKHRSLQGDIHASEFEILTATAFEIFNRCDIEVGVVEVGLGGRHDATNVVCEPAVTLITKIGEDHQAFLGHTLEEIASHKAGIVKRGALCLVDGSNKPTVLDTIKRLAEEYQARACLLVPQDFANAHANLLQTPPRLDLEPHQLMNVDLAAHAAQEMLRVFGRPVPAQQMLEAVQDLSWPGRLQRLSLRNVAPHQPEILLDGAHNPQAAEVLGNYVDKHLRGSSGPVTWLVGLSKGKKVEEVLSKCLRAGDSVVATTFTAVEGMPWISCMEPVDIVTAARSCCPLSQIVEAPRGVGTGLRMAASIADGGPLVVTGSLYLVSDVLRLQRQGDT